MQFRQRDKEAIARGEQTLTFRRWRRPQARSGGRYRVGQHVIEVTSVEQIDPSEISAEDARAAGHDSAEDALAAIRRTQRKSGDANAPLYRVAFRCLGEQADPRSILAADSGLKSGRTERHHRSPRKDGRTRQTRTMDASRAGGNLLPIRVVVPPNWPPHKAARPRSSRPTCANSKRSASRPASRLDTNSHREDASSSTRYKQPRRRPIRSDATRRSRERR